MARIIVEPWSGPPPATSFGRQAAFAPRPASLAGGGGRGGRGGRAVLGPRVLRVSPAEFAAQERDNARPEPRRSLVTCTARPFGASRWTVSGTRRPRRWAPGAFRESLAVGIRSRRGASGRSPRNGATAPERDVFWAPGRGARRRGSAASTSVRRLVEPREPHLSLTGERAPLAMRRLRPSGEGRVGDRGAGAHQPLQELPGSASPSGNWSSPRLVDGRLRPPSLLPAPGATGSVDYRAP